MARRLARVNRSWALYNFGIAIATASPFQSFVLAQDDENAFGVLGRPLRINGAVNVVVSNGAVLPSVSLTHIYIGCAVIDQDLSNGLNIAGTQQADRRFLARENLGGYPGGTGLSGAVGTYAWTHRFDWPIRGGKGVALKRDDAFVMCCGMTSGIAGQGVLLSFSFDLLFETD